MTPTSEALKLAEQAMRMVCLDLPHLAGLARKVELCCDRRVEAAGVTASGLIILNPDWFTAQTLADASFVLAHELMHLVLDHHARMDASFDPWTYNVVQDCIINDMLVTDLGREAPEGCLWYPRAREESVEGVLAKLQGLQRGPLHLPVWTLVRRPMPWSDKAAIPGAFLGLPDTKMTKGLVEAGFVEPFNPAASESAGIPYDLISGSLEKRWFPDRRVTVGAREIGRTARKALSQAAFFQELRNRESHGRYPGNWEATVDAHTTAYLPPWETAIQSWLEDRYATYKRSWARPSRRQGTRRDVVLPGRAAEGGGTLNVVLDTSGSMTGVLAYLLGVLANFCDMLNIQQARVVQCDTKVTSDDKVEPQELTRFKLSGFGGSDMTPAMNLLNRDSTVESVVVITDGWISYPSNAPRYNVLWAVTASYGFNPTYGVVTQVELPPFESATRP